mgnify:CR=1 FL=1
MLTVTERVCEEYDAPRDVTLQDVERFMAEHGYPPGPMFLTDWGPTEEGWFRSGAA